MSELIYLDNAATTAVRQEAYRAMEPYFIQNYGNPASIYRFAGESRKAVEEARESIAEAIGGKAEQIFFTGGGSESDNWAIKGIAEALQKKGKHIITSAIEHHAVLHTCEYLEKQGYEVTYLGVDGNGLIDLQELEKAIRPDTILITIMFANNEIGTIQPVAEIGRIAREHGVLFHTDAVQAVGHVPVNVEEMNIDMLSASGHKFHGPKGIGFLYIGQKMKPANLIHGGAQERGMRGGTLNVPGIVGMAEALKLAVEELPQNQKKLAQMRDHLIQRVLEEVPYCRLNGHREQRLPGNAHFCFSFIEGESLLILLDQRGICASSGSACTSGSLDPSHVLLAIGLPHEIAHGSLRLTLSAENTMKDMDTTVEAIKGIVERLRSMSPLYDDFVRKQKA